MQIIKDFFRKYIAPILITFFYMLYHCTLRLSLENAPRHVTLSRFRRWKPHHPCVYTHWHGDELVLVGWGGFSGLGALVSHSKDGDLMGGVLKLLGYKVLRGSSTRGGAGGFLGMVRAIKKEGHDMSFAVDGPKGPIHKVKPGALKMASVAKAQIYPMAVISKKKYVFEKSWNKTFLPHPFSKVVIRFGEPMKIPEKISESDQVKYSEELEKRLNGLYSSQSLC